MFKFLFKFQNYVIQMFKSRHLIGFDNIIFMLKISFKKREMNLNKRNSPNWQEWQYFNNDIKIIATLNEWQKCLHSIRFVPKDYKKKCWRTFIHIFIGKRLSRLVGFIFFSVAFNWISAQTKYRRAHTRKNILKIAFQFIIATVWCCRDFYLKIEYIWNWHSILWLWTRQTNVLRINL